METTGMQGSQTGTQYAGEAQAAVNTASDRVHETVDRAAGAANATLQQLSEKSEEWMAMGNQAMESTRSYVRENPFVALGVALAVGVLLARITR
jgi:ElaB/YqjD/DUF883 family membrane-anchored ribosome-binding protein